MYKNLTIRIQIFRLDIGFCSDSGPVIPNTYLIKSRIEFGYNFFCHIRIWIHPDSARIRPVDNPTLILQASSSVGFGSDLDVI